MPSSNMASGENHSGESLGVWDTFPDFPFPGSKLPNLLPLDWNQRPSFPECFFCLTYFASYLTRETQWMREVSPKSKHYLHPLTTFPLLSLLISGWSTEKSPLICPKHWAGECKLPRPIVGVHCRGFGSGNAKSAIMQVIISQVKVSFVWREKAMAWAEVVKNIFWRESSCNRLSFNCNVDEPEVFFKLKNLRWQKATGFSYLPPFCIHSIVMCCKRGRQPCSPRRKDFEHGN